MKKTCCSWLKGRGNGSAPPLKSHGHFISLISALILFAGLQSGATFICSACHFKKNLINVRTQETVIRNISFNFPPLFFYTFMQFFTFVQQRKNMWFLAAVVDPLLPQSLSSNVFFSDGTVWNPLLKSPETDDRGQQWSSSSKSIIHSFSKNSYFLFCCGLSELFHCRLCV